MEPMNEELKSHYDHMLNNGHEHLRALEIALSNTSYNRNRKAVDDRTLSHQKGLVVHDYVMGYDAGIKDTNELATYTEIEEIISSVLSAPETKAAMPMIEFMANKLSELRAEIIADIQGGFSGDSLISKINDRFDEVSKEASDESD